MTPPLRHLAVGLAALVLATRLEAARGPRGSQVPPSDARGAEARALFDADRAYAARARETTLVPALTAMFLPDVIVPGPDGLVRGIDAVAAALRAVPENAGSRVDWQPIGGGLSADATHGYTFGFMTVTPAAGAVTRLKYMAYWIRQADGWKVAGYKRARRPDGEVPSTPLPLRVPAAAAVVTGPERLEAQRRSLAAAEQAFSDRAQAIGLGPAFVEFGAPDAVNMGGPSSPGFIVGNAAIGGSIGAGAPGPKSPVAWSSDAVLVAPSGDLGISFGYIRPHAPPPGAPPGGQPFFTVWARRDASAPWRYVAE